MKPWTVDFQDKVDYSGAAAGSSCYEWTGIRLPTGYGVVARKAKSKRISKYAHRIAYEIAFGPIPNGLSVLHRCDNPPCVRPDHLFLGTYADNTHDSMRKGRHSPPPRFIGESHPNAKVSNADAAFIRENYRPGKPGHVGNREALAKRFGISMSQVSRIVSGKRWSGDASK